MFIYILYVHKVEAWIQAFNWNTIYFILSPICIIFQALTRLVHNSSCTIYALRVCLELWFSNWGNWFFHNIINLFFGNIDIKFFSPCTFNSVSCTLLLGSLCRSFILLIFSLVILTSNSSLLVHSINRCRVRYCWVVCVFKDHSPIQFIDDKICIVMNYFVYRRITWIGW